MNKDEKVKSIELEIKNLKNELAPKSEELDRLYDEQNKIYDLMETLQRRVNEINSITQDERCKTGKRSVKKEGLLTQVSHLKNQVQSLERVRDIYLES